VLPHACRGINFPSGQKDANKHWYMYKNGLQAPDLKPIDRVEPVVGLEPTACCLRIRLGKSRHG